MSETPPHHPPPDDRPEDEGAPQHPSGEPPAYGSQQAPQQPQAYRYPSYDQPAPQPPAAPGYATGGQPAYHQPQPYPQQGPGTEPPPYQTQPPQQPAPGYSTGEQPAYGSQQAPQQPQPYSQQGGYAAPAGHPPGQPAGQGGPDASEGTTWAMIAHLGGVVLSCFGWLVALVVYLMKKDQSAYVRHQASEALNFQLTLLLAYIAAWAVYLGLGIFAWELSPIGSVLIGVIWVVAIAFGVLAAIQVMKGNWYRYPVSIRMVK